MHPAQNWPISFNTAGLVSSGMILSFKFCSKIQKVNVGPGMWNHIVIAANENSAVRIIQTPKLHPILNAVLMMNIHYKVLQWNMRVVFHFCT